MQSLKVEHSAAQNSEHEREESFDYSLGEADDVWKKNMNIVILLT